MLRILVSRNVLRIAAIAAFSLTALTANAQVKPFYVTGGGPAPLGVSIIDNAVSPHEATGNATLLGKYSGDQGMFTSLSFDLGAGMGTFKGSFVFVAANGDELFCTYGQGAEGPGEYQICDAGGGDIVVCFLAEFNPVPALCTGRFQKVIDGSFTMLAMTEPIPLASVLDDGVSAPFDLTWEGEGWLEFREGPR